MHRIYVITNTVNGKVYVGQTQQKGLKRWQQHKNCVTSGPDYPIYRSMRKHGVDKFTYEEISQTPDKDWAIHLERTWIYFLKANDQQHGYVCSSGGDGRTGPNDEVRWRKSNSLRRTFSDKTRHAKWRAEIVAEEVARLHVEEMWTVLQLAEHFDCSDSTIKLRLRSVGVRVGRGRHTPESRRKASKVRIGMKLAPQHCRQISISKTGHRTPKRRDIVDREVTDLYTYGFSSTDVSRMMDCNPGAITYRLKVLGIPTRSQKKAA